MPHNLTRDKVRDTRCFQHRHCTVAQTVERNLAWLPRLRASLLCLLVSAWSHKASIREEIVELADRKRRRSTAALHEDTAYCTLIERDRVAEWRRWFLPIRSPGSLFPSRCSRSRRARGAAFRARSLACRGGESPLARWAKIRA